MIFQALERLTNEVRKLNITNLNHPDVDFGVVRHRHTAAKQTSEQTRIVFLSVVSAQRHIIVKSCSFTNQGNWFLEIWVQHSLPKHYLITTHFFSNRLHIPNTLYDRYRCCLQHIAFETSHWKTASITDFAASRESFTVPHVRSNFSFFGLGIAKRFFVDFHDRRSALLHSGLGFSAPL